MNTNLIVKQKPKHYIRICVHAFFLKLIQDKESTSYEIVCASGYSIQNKENFMNTNLIVKLIPKHYIKIRIHALFFRVDLHTPKHNTPMYPGFPLLEVGCRRLAALLSLSLSLKECRRI